MKKLPKGWKIEFLGSLADWGSGGTPKKSNTEYYGGDIKWAIIGDLNGSILNDTKNRITKKGLEKSSAKLVPQNTLLIGMYGSIGKTAITGCEMATNQAIAFAKPKESLDLNYLKYYIDFSQEALFKLSKGGTQKNISQEVLKKFQIPFPSIIEQKLIVQEIEKQFSRLDEAVKSLKSTKKKLETYRKSVLKAAFEGKLISFKGKTITSGLGDEFTIIMGQSPSSENYNRSNEGLPFFQGKKEFGNVYPSVEIWTRKASKIAEKDDVLLSIRAPIGPVNLAPCKCGIGRGLAAIKPNKITKSKLIYFLLKLNEDLLNQKGTGTTFKAITKSNLFNFRVQLPVLKEDRDMILQEIELQFSTIDKLEEILNNSLRKSERLRKSILKAAFEGKLVRFEDDKND